MGWSGVVTNSLKARQVFLSSMCNIGYRVFAMVAGFGTWPDPSSRHVINKALQFTKL